MNLAILGASGATGRLVVDAALARGHHASALVRDPEAFAQPRDNLAIVRGDPHDPADQRRCLAGCDAVISTLGPHGLGHTTLVADCARVTVAVMSECQLDRLVVVGVGALFRVGVVPRILAATFLRNIAADSAEMERIVTASKLDWTIARAPRLTNGSGRGRYLASDERIARRFGLIATVSLARTDLAQFLVDEVERPAHVRHIVGVS